MSFKDRRWYDWVLIVFGVLVLLTQLMAALSLVREAFKWTAVISGAVFLWFGTVPRKPKT